VQNSARFQNEGGSAVERRCRDIERLQNETWDLLIVGGGITGVASALEATLRGAKVALIEREDVAVGTSSRSSKLIHGGLRYLEQFRFGLVLDALRERAALLRLAPHLVRLERFVVPVSGRPHQVPYLGAGLALYGMLGAARDGGWPTYVLPSAARRDIPALRAEGLRGVFTYTDAVADDARLALAVARTAARAGSLVMTQMEASDYSDFDPSAIVVRDRLTDGALRVRARLMVDATGASHPDGAIVPSRGSHIVVERSRIPSPWGMTLRVRRRVVFIVPWERFWIIGTTDVPHEGPTSRPSATREEVQYLIAHTNEALDIGLRVDDVVATFAGIRPLAAMTIATDTVNASREHVVERRGNLVRVRGGKYTTFRRVARDVVDAALGKPGGGMAMPVWPELVGALETDRHDAETDRLVRRHGLEPDRARRLITRYGAEARDVAETSAASGLLTALGETDYLEGEVLWAVQREWALSVDDILARRLRVVLEQRDNGMSVARRVAEIVGTALGWTPEKQSTEVARFREAARREYGVPPPIETPQG
jgi:glycerol-3-phosphate dehydrogenase